MPNIFSLFAGGVIGTLLRYAATLVLASRLGQSFPFGTFIVNMTGCFLAGFFSVMLSKKTAMSDAGRLLFITGFCGAFTTFSTWIFESDQLLRQGEVIKLVINVCGSVIFGLILLRLGMKAAQLV